MHKRIWSFLSALMLGLFVLLPAGLAFADSYEVSATVPAQLPPAAVPEVTTPQTNTEFKTPTVEVTGTCPVVTPALIVVLVRDDQTLGSGSCSLQGTFRIAIGLVLGQNVIRSKFMTITGASGGWGDTITLNYAPIAGQTTENGGPNNSTKPVRIDLGPLAVGLDYDFITFNTSDATPVTISVKGGTPPYKLFVGWGDNSTKVYLIKNEDTFVVSHLYRNVPDQPMKLLLKLEDAAGGTAQTERALVSFEKPRVPASSPAKTIGSVLNSNGHDGLPLLEVWFLATTAAMLAVVISYSLWAPAHASKTLSGRMPKGRSSHLQVRKPLPKKRPKL